MQALGRLFGSSDLSSVAETLRDLPQQLLRQTAGAGDGSLHRRGRVSGDHNFHFSLHFEPRSDGGGLCQTGVLMAKAMTRAEGGQPVPVKCRWKRRIGAHLIEIPGTDVNMYHTSADDIGMELCCVVESATHEYRGTAVGTLGPFELDPITRMSLENLISSGASRFPVRHYRDQDDPHPRDLQIHVTQDCVKVVHPGADRGSQEVVAHYTADFPKVVLHPLDTLKFILELNEDRDKVYHFVALSRTSRDLIALLIRCFHSRKYVATSFILSRLFQNPATPGAPPTLASPQDFSVQALCGRLGRELDRTVGQLETVDRVVRNANEEKGQLQAQLRETISSYTEAIEKLHQQLAFAKGGPAATLQLQLHDAKAVHQRLQMETQELKVKLEEERSKAPSQNEASEVDVLQEEITRLRNGIGSLAGEAASHSQRDHTRSEELRRLRQDVETLNAEKEGLEKCCVQAEKEKQDLVENFLYVKGCLDKLQWASLQTPAASPEVEREVAMLKANYNQVVDERNRLGVRVEALDRDREKQKAHRESALERVMNANARLLEERDRLEKEKARVSELYQSTMGAMGAVTEAGGGVGGGADAITPADLEAMKAELAQKAELLGKREQESESLRSRLRKLAMI
eukprot:TRINITY_DN76044_c0_g1_i1.p1 TRINITY_DN76044_c0_g1~~TRINITY_DN76044_c0_g1_i1.p1  ORF type:complete len:631 (-),score=142.80 TRINITY_DN76044_c0_g1_i1:39-1931(-)